MSDTLSPLEAAEIMEESARQAKCMIDAPTIFFSTASQSAGVDRLKKCEMAYSLAASLLRAIVAGEYKRVVHGRWVNMPFNVDNDKYGMNKYNMRIKCTNCGFVTSSELKYAHCPVCGALMGKDDSR